jgi:glutaredoxin
VSVLIYTKPGCPYCAAAKSELMAQGVEYEEIDVTTSPGGMDKLAELTLGSMLVPVIVEPGGAVRVAAGGG